METMEAAEGQLHQAVQPHQVVQEDQGVLEVPLAASSRGPRADLRVGAPWQ